MTNINETMERLSAVVAEAEKWGHLQGNITDLKALLSYTKQCREALSEMIKVADQYVASGSDLARAIKADQIGPIIDEARQALSTQPGERE